MMAKMFLFNCEVKSVLMETGGLIDKMPLLKKNVTDCTILKHLYKGILLQHEGN